MKSLHFNALRTPGTLEYEAFAAKYFDDRFMKAQSLKIDRIDDFVARHFVRLI
jgi:hypothetical protein